MRIISELMERGRKKLVGQSWLDGYVTPDYRSFNIAGVACEVLRHFGATRGDGPRLPKRLLAGQLEGSNVLVLLVVDGLGYDLSRLLMSSQHSPFSKLSDGAFSPITTTFPSTTSTALTTLCTGLTPAEHGVIGYTMYLKELGLVANMISFSAAADNRRGSLIDLGLDPAKFLRRPTVFELLAREGIKASVLTKNVYRNSALSKIIHSGARMHTFVSSSDMFVRLRKLISEGSDASHFIFVYWDSVDTATHVYGPNSEEVAAEVEGFAYSLRTLLVDKLDPEIGTKTSIIVTADHGSCAVEASKTVFASKHRRLMELLRMPPTGDSRAAFLHVKEGRLPAVEAFFQEKIPQGFTLLESRKALELGLFGLGKPRRDLMDRIGDVIALSKPGYSLLYPYRRGRGESTSLRGSHGGLTEEEVLVPLLCSRLN